MGEGFGEVRTEVVVRAGSRLRSLDSVAPPRSSTRFAIGRSFDLLRPREDVEWLPAEAANAWTM